jgi:hypothetical protein
MIFAVTDVKRAVWAASMPLENSIALSGQALHRRKAFDSSPRNGANNGVYFGSSDGETENQYRDPLQGRFILGACDRGKPICNKGAISALSFPKHLLIIFRHFSRFQF